MDKGQIKHLKVSEKQPGQDFKGQRHCSKVKGQIKIIPMMVHTKIPQPMSLPCINFPIPEGFRNIAQTRFSNSRSLRHGQRSNQVTP